MEKWKMEHQILSYGIFAENNLKLSTINEQNELDQKVYPLDDEELDVHELMEEYRPQFLLFEEETEEEFKSQFLNLVPLEQYNEAIISKTQNFGSFKDYVTKSFSHWCLTNNLYYI